ncbi:MAG: histidine phosphatase family protein [Chitinophagales bacterium]|nr:histidine phosphatase family protein [Chitinophagales bacterium]MDW8274645.1 histidine phosphatase family protein [Chitinophagales bacterium]
MKTFILVRHTKSSWKNTSLPDIERPLKKDRIEDAISVSCKLRDLDFQPQLIISSPAKRAYDTAQIFARVLSYPIDKIKIDHSIYESSEKELLQLINSLDPKYERVMIFGHNPCFENFLSEYTNSDIEELPTTGTVWLEIEEDEWKITKKKKAIQRHFFTPKALKKERKAMS